MEVRKVGAGHGGQWIRTGYGLFKQNPVIWISLFFIYLLIVALISSFPIVGRVVGPLLGNLLAPVFMAGFMLGCQALESGEELEINHLFAGFKNNASQLITVGGLYLVGLVIIAGIFYITTGATLMNPGTPMPPGAEHAEAAMAETGAWALVVLLIGLVVLFALVMAYWFAPTLVVFHGMGAVEAMKLSFVACLRNMMPFLVYGVMLVAILLALAMTIGVVVGMLLTPLLGAAAAAGIGGVVLFAMYAPTCIASIYASYKDIFSEQVTA